MVPIVKIPAPGDHETSLKNLICKFSFARCPCATNIYASTSNKHLTVISFQTLCRLHKIQDVTKKSRKVLFYWVLCRNIYKYLAVSHLLYFLYIYVTLYLLIYILKNYESKTIELFIDRNFIVDIFINFGEHFITLY